MTVNHWVGGSSPPRGATFFRRLWCFCSIAAMDFQSISLTIGIAFIHVGKAIIELCYLLPFYNIFKRSSLFVAQHSQSHRNCLYRFIKKKVYYGTF